VVIVRTGTVINNILVVGAGLAAAPTNIGYAVWTGEDPNRTTDGLEWMFFVEGERRSLVVNGVDAVSDAGAPAKGEVYSLNLNSDGKAILAPTVGTDIGENDDERKVITRVDIPSNYIEYREYATTNMVGYLGTDVKVFNLSGEHATWAASNLEALSNGHEIAVIYTGTGANKRITHIFRMARTADEVIERDDITLVTTTVTLEETTTAPTVSITGSNFSVDAVWRSTNASGAVITILPSEGSTVHLTITLTADWGYAFDISSTAGTSLLEAHLGSKFNITGLTGNTFVTYTATASTITITYTGTTVSS